MKKEVILKNWRLTNQHDMHDIAYKYCQQVIDLFIPYDPKKLDRQKNRLLNLFNEKSKDLIFNKTIAQQFFKKFERLTKIYLIATNDHDKLKQLLETKKQINRKDLNFEILYQALMLARSKINYVVEVQFSFIETFVMVLWFYGSLKTTSKIIKNLSQHTFAYPGISFESQYEIALQSVKLNSLSIRSKENKINVLFGILDHFLFHDTLSKIWIDLLPKNSKEGDIEKCQTDFFEWIMLYYLLPLYGVINSYKENDPKFKELIRELFYYDFKQPIVLKACEMLLQVEKQILDLNNRELIDLYELAKPKILNYQKHFNSIIINQAKINNISVI